MTYDEIITDFLEEKPEFVVVEYDEPHSAKEWTSMADLLKEKIMRGRCAGFLLDENDQEIRLYSMDKSVDREIEDGRDLHVVSAFPKEMVASMTRLEESSKPTEHVAIFWIDRYICSGRFDEVNGDDKKAHPCIVVNAGHLLPDAGDNCYRVSHDLDPDKTVNYDETTIISRAIVKRIVYYG